MDEKEEKNEEKSEEDPKIQTETVKTEETRIEEKPTSIIDEAAAERIKIEEATEKLKQENNRTEEIMAKQALSGRTEAGSGIQEKAEETPKEYSDRVMKGEG